MAAVLSRNLNEVDKLSKFMDECKAMGIQVLGPDINESYKTFSANRNGDIRFGLGGIKGVGGNAVDAVISEREQNGPFKDIYDVMERINLSACNRKAIESMALAGAVDCFEGVTREAFFVKNARDEQFSDILVRFGQKFQAGQSSMQNSLFGDIEPIEIAKPPIPAAEQWHILERLNKEKELVGMYLSAHPLDPYYMEITYGCTTKLADLPDKADQLDRELVVGGLVVDYQTRMSKKGNQFGILKIEDYSGSYELRLFGQNFIDYGKYGVLGTPIIVRGAYERRRYGDGIDFNIHSVTLLETLKGKMVRNLRIEIDDSDVELMNDIKPLLAPSAENRAELYFRVRDVNNGHHVDLRSKNRIAINKQLIDALREIHINFKINVY